MTYIVHNFDAETNEVIEREMTAEEIAELEAYQAERAIKRAEEKAKAYELKVNKISAYRKMAITDKEIVALIGLEEEEIVEFLGLTKEEAKLLLS